MGVLIPLLLLGLPIAEIAGFVVIGGRIGVLATLAWVLLAAIAGIVVMRLTGLATALQLRAALARDEPPARALFDGALVAVAGLLLLFPGFVSDAIAIVLLFPPLRAALFRLAAWRFATHVQVRPSGGAGARRQAGGVVIEGEFSEVDEGPEARRGREPAPEEADTAEAAPRRLPGRGGSSPWA